MKQKTIIFTQLSAIAVNGLMVVMNYRIEAYILSMISSFMCGILVMTLIYGLYLHRNHTKRLKTLDDWHVRSHFGVDEVKNDHQI